MSPEERERVRRYVARLDRERATLAAELEEELAPVRNLSPAQRAEWVASVCRSAWTILRARPDMRELIALREPPAPDFDTLWQRLMARWHRQRSTASP